MRRSWLTWLGLLGFIVLLGPLTGRPSLAGFLGFFGCFAWRAIVNDERMRMTSALACRNAFIAAMVTFAATVVATTVFPGAGERLVVNAYAIGFAVQMLTFVVSLVYYDQRGDVA
jgi:hypothetical protein